jgi:hypothetical protein
LGWLWLAMAGCAAVERKLLCRKSCFSELNRLANLLAGWLWGYFEAKST